jgi:hypothetical protein
MTTPPRSAGTILILTEENDPHADHVQSILVDQGASVVRLGTSTFPTRLQATLRSGRADSRTLAWPGGTLSLDDVSTVWLRRPQNPTAPAAIEDRLTRECIESESSYLLHNLWASMACRWVPGPPDVLRRGAMKYHQLRLAAEMGVTVPDTIITNDPDEAIEFYRVHDGRIISKMMGNYLASGRVRLFRFTEKLTTSSLAHFGVLRQCPMQFQAYVEKKRELRVTVIGEHVFAAEIDSQATHRTRFDYRRYQRGTPYRVHEMPARMVQFCRDLTRRLGLLYGAIDFIVTPDDDYVFLEINPNGQYLWTEGSTGMPITDHLCALLRHQESEPQS